MSDPDTLPENFALRYGKWALIAGGSEGTGAAFARYLAAAGLNLVLLARREAPLHALADTLCADFAIDVDILALDVTAGDAFERITQATAQRQIGLLIYNLGSNIHYDRFTQWPMDTLNAMLQMNCVLPTQLAHHYAGPMATSGRGGIILLGSMASMAGSAYMSIYPATKAYLHILAEGLWRDLKPAGIDVMCSILGATNTPSHQHMTFDKLEDSNESSTNSMVMECADVATETLAQLGRRPTWVTGEHNRALLPPGFLESRAELVEMMSLSTAAIAGLGHPPLNRDLSE